ncbi:Uncharacterised protein [Ectopseudomonas mendocina]|jgi:hypothetical protein|nr:Uncharacterised protein [Pseudomonas mendocina]
MAQGDGALAMKAVGVGAARGEVVSDALDCRQVRGASIKT